MKLVLAPDDRLRVVCRPLEAADLPSLPALVAAMLDVMYSHDGVGIAAPQVGSDLRVIVVDPSAGEVAGECLVMVDPVLVSTISATCLLEVAPEGCLSLPGQLWRVTRPTVASVRYRDVEGRSREATLHGLVARAFQHELDHLNGVLVSDVGVLV